MDYTWGGREDESKAQSSYAAREASWFKAGMLRKGEWEGWQARGTKREEFTPLERPLHTSPGREGNETKRNGATPGFARTVQCGTVQYGTVLCFVWSASAPGLQFVLSYIAPLRPSDLKRRHARGNSATPGHELAAG
ncbi:hypothetical protein B7463_g6245, partial [Scytalidium lignicola]